MSYSSERPRTEVAKSLGITSYMIYLVVQEIYVGNRLNNLCHFEQKPQSDELGVH